MVLFDSALKCRVTDKFQRNPDALHVAWGAALARPDSSRPRASSLPPCRVRASLLASESEQSPLPSLPPNKHGARGRLGPNSQLTHSKKPREKGRARFRDVSDQLLSFPLSSGFWILSPHWKPPFRTGVEQTQAEVT